MPDWSTIAESLPQIRVVLAAFVGTVALFVLAKQRNQQPFSLFAALGLRRKSPAVASIDMMLSCAVGTYVVVILTAPATEAQGMAAGLGMSGLLQAFGTKDRDLDDG
jgi:hypothetical protein